MTFVHREATYIKLGTIEAYAHLKRRVMTIQGSDVLFVVQAADPRAIPEVLGSLREGNSILTRDLAPIIPWLADMPSTFTPADANTVIHALTTLGDDIAAIFQLAQAKEDDPTRAEAKLRGIQAKFVVSMLWPPEH